jgi:hypothetical protein
MLEDGAGVQQSREIKSVVVGGGRRPHVSLHSKTIGAAARHNETGPPRGFRSSRLGFDLVAAVDGDPRGFMASATSRINSIISSPLSNEAFLTWT